MLSWKSSKETVSKRIKEKEWKEMNYSATYQHGLSQNSMEQKKEIIQCISSYTKAINRQLLVIMSLRNMYIGGKNYKKVTVITKLRIVITSRDGEGMWRGRAHGAFWGEVMFHFSAWAVDTWIFFTVLPTIHIHFNCILHFTLKRKDYRTKEKH